MIARKRLVRSCPPLIHVRINHLEHKAQLVLKTRLSRSAAGCPMRLHTSNLGPMGTESAAFSIHCKKDRSTLPKQRRCYGQSSEAQFTSIRSNHSTAAARMGLRACRSVIHVSIGRVVQHLEGKKLTVPQRLGTMKSLGSLSVNAIRLGRKCQWAFRQATEVQGGVGRAKRTRPRPRTR